MVSNEIWGYFAQPIPAELWAHFGLALVLGVALGWAIAQRVEKTRFSNRLRVATEELELRHAEAAKELRASQTRAHMELEQARLSFKRQLASAENTPRAAIQEAEQRLRAAYDEMERLRRATSAALADRPTLGLDRPESKASGRAKANTQQDFAATEIMHTGRGARRQASPSGFPATAVMDESRPEGVSKKDSTRAFAATEVFKD